MGFLILAVTAAGLFATFAIVRLLLSEADLD